MPGEGCRGEDCGLPLYPYHDLQTQEECEDICVWEGYNDQTGDNNNNSTGGSGNTGNSNDSEPTDVATSPVDPRCPSFSGKIYVNGDCICPIGTKEDENGKCVPLNKPCKGDPVPNPEIAPQKGASGVKGGMYGCNRFNKEKTCGGVKGRFKHSGVDIRTSYGDPIFATHDGTARLITQYNKKGTKVIGAGHYVEITSTINNKTVKILYFHLQKDSRKSGVIKAGDIIGYQGDSGNLKNGITQGYAESHVHIKVKENGVAVNPNDYLGTKFDPNTREVSQNPTNCN